MAKSKETIGKVALRGKIFGLEKAKDNIVDNEKQRRINFIIKTDNDNAHYVSVNQWKNGMKKAYLFNDDNEQKVVSWAERYDYIDDGFKPIGIKTKANTEDETKILYEYDFIDFLLENFEDGDSVFTRGELTFSQGEDKVYKNIDITHFFPTTNEVDFDAEDFTETADFELSFAFKKSHIMGDKVIVDGFVFDYNEIPIKQSFVVHNNVPELQKYLAKKAGYGDMFPVEGILHNRVTYKEKEKGKSEGNGMGTKSGSFDNSYVEREIDSERKELQLMYSEMPTQGVYNKKEIEAMKNGTKKVEDKDVTPDDSNGDAPWD